MKHMLGLAIAILLTGCASTYKPLHRETMGYQKSGEGSAVEVAYKYNVLAESDNLKYDRKARLNGVNVVAVKIKNNTAQPINTRDQLEFFVGGGQAIPSNAKMALNPVRQRTGLYFLYLLMSPLTIYKSEVKCSNFDCDEDVTFFPIGLILGLGLTALNAGISSSANSSISSEIGGHDLYGQTIQPGKEASGYLVFRDIGIAPLTARLKSNAGSPASAPANSPAGEGTGAAPASSGEFR